MTGLADELEMATRFDDGDGSGEARVIREVLYALDREYGAEAVYDQLNYVARHDSAYREAREKRKEEHRNGRVA